LSEHDQLVTGIDWAPKTNRIVTCSEDRNAYVWVSENGTWKPTLVILRINRAATDVKWSPNEDKFAVASGAKLVSVCYFEEDNDWWVSKHVKKHKSTVLSVDWHPNNTLLLTSSSDYKVRVFAAAVKGVDKKPQGPVLGLAEKMPAFGETVAEISDLNGWVHNAAWSPNGNMFAAVGHDSAIVFVDCTSSPPKTQKLKLSGLPLLSLVWANDTTVVAGGHENTPIVFQGSVGSFKQVKKLDDAKGAGGAAAATANKPKALGMWQSQVERGNAGGASTGLSTKHQNCIMAVRKYKGTQAATVGRDGRLIVWPL